jgi:hypothetical protein
MSIADIKARLRSVPGSETLTMKLEGGKQVFTLNGVSAAVGCSASDSEIETAIRSAIRLPPVNITEAKPMSITGAAYIAGSIKAKIEAAKARVAQVGANIDAGVTKLNSIADQGDQIAKTINAEADALSAELGQFSNGAPD